MTLLDVLVQISKEASNAQQPTDMAVGTVISTSPLAISLDVSQANITADLLYLTSAVVEKKLSYLGHTHSVSGGQTGSALETAVCTENGQALESGPNGITLNRGLQPGDKVLLLAVQHGQKFIVLSRLF